MKLFFCIVVAFAQVFSADAPISVNSISALRALQGGSAQTVEVRGYYSPGDGGGGQFYWDGTSTSSQDSCIYFSPFSGLRGRWVRVLKGTLNVKECGAYGDSIHTDRTSINQAIKACQSVYIPRGKYLVDSSVLILSNRRIYGDGGYNSFLVSKSVDSTNFWGLMYSSGKSNWSIEGIGFDNTANYPIDSTTVPNQGIYKNDSFRFPTISGIWAQSGGSNIKIDKCYFSHITSWGIRFQKGSSSSQIYKRISITNNVMQNSNYVGKAIGLSGYDFSSMNDGLIISGNTVDSGSVTRYNNPGIGTQNASTDGIELVYQSHFVVTGNTVRRTAGSCYRIERSSFGTVSGNAAEYCGESGISLYNSVLNVTVSGNSVYKWGAIPNLGSLRKYGGNFYLAREAPDASLAPFPADPSVSSWWVLNPYSLHGASTYLTPTYNTGNYYNASIPFTSLSDGGVVTNASNFNVASDQGVLPFRGDAGISVIQASGSVVVSGNNIVGDTSKTGGLYNYASDFGISIVHPTNLPINCPNPAIFYNNLIKGYIRSSIYQPSYVDPINTRGVISGVINYASNYSSDSVDNLSEIPFSFPKMWVTGTSSLSGDVTVGSGSGAPQININGAKSQLKGINIQSNGVERWYIYSSNSPSESGNSGAPLKLSDYDSAGTFISDVWKAQHGSRSPFVVSRPSEFSDTVLFDSAIVGSASDFRIRQNTQSSSDNKRTQISGSGAFSQSRGAYISLFGNDYSSPNNGVAQIISGTNAASKIIMTARGTNVLTMTDTASVLANRLQFALVGGVASANDLTLPIGGNVFKTTGTTTINRIATTTWQSGSTVTVILPASGVIADKGASTSGALARIHLSGAANFTAGANGGTCTLVYDGTDWYAAAACVSW